MSDSGLYLDDAIPDRAPAPSRTERILRWSIAALSAVLACELAWFLAVVPCLPLKSVEVGGDLGLPRAAVLAAAGLNSSSSYFSVGAGATERALEAALPELETATVTKRFPDTVRIVLTRRAAVAVALANVGGKCLPVAIDRNGVVFRVGAPSDGVWEGPVISGLVFDDPRPGVKLPAFLGGLVADLARLRAQAPALLDSISEIRVVKRSYDAYELVLYPAYRPVRVRVGPQLNEDVLRYMMLLLDVLDSKGIRTDELDFRTGTAAYRAKEG